MRSSEKSSLTLISKAGAVQTSYTYEPFGKTTITGTPSTNPFQYTGRENDETGLYYYRARYYSPTMQRFISEDPIGLAGLDLSFYAYVRNSPINFTDSTGLIVDTLADLAFIGYDLYRLAADGRKGVVDNLTALGLDVSAFFVPGVTGLGPASRFAKTPGGKNVNPFKGPVDRPIVVVDPKGNAIPVKPGDRLTGSPDGKWIQVRDANGQPTGMRLDGPHNPTSHSDPRALQPHAHVPGIANPDGTPWLPVK